MICFGLSAFIDLNHLSGFYEKNLYRPFSGLMKFNSVQLKKYWLSDVSELNTLIAILNNSQKPSFYKLEEIEVTCSTDTGQNLGNQPFQ